MKRLGSVLTRATIPVAALMLGCDEPALQAASSSKVEAAQVIAPQAQAPVKRPELSERPTVAVLDVTLRGGAWRGSLVPVEEAITQTAATMQEIRLVERTQLQRAMDELVQASALGGDALKLGRMVGAELLVRPVLRTTDETVLLEYIDLRHADVVHSRELKMGTSKVDATLIEKISAHVPEDVRAACAQIRARQGKVLVAPVFFRNSGPIDRLNYVGPQLTSAIVGSGTEQVSVLSLAQLDEAAQEADLAFLGMTDVDPDLWQNLADVYVWGSYREVAPPAENGTSTPAGDVPVEMSITLWNGAGETAEITRKTTIGGLRGEMAAIAQEVCQRAATMKPQSIQPAARQDLVKMLHRTGTAQQSDYASKCLELAVFMAPQDANVICSRIAALEKEKNATLEHRLKQLRWTHRMQSRHPQHRESARRLVSALTGALRAAKPEDGKAATEHQLSSLRLILQEAIAHAKSRRDQPSPKDGFAPQYADLIREIGPLPDELLDQKVQAILAIWPLARGPYLEYTGRSSQQVTQLGGYNTEGIMYRALASAGKGDMVKQMFWIEPEGAKAATGTELAQGTPREVLARVSATWPASLRVSREPAPRKPEEFASVWRCPPEEMAWIDAPAAYHSVTHRGRDYGNDGARVTLLEDRGIIWAAIWPAHHPRLTRFDPATGAMEDLTNKLNVNTPVTCLLSHSGAIWVGTQGDGIRRVDAQTLEVTSFGTAEGLRSSNVTGMAAHGDRLYVSGGGLLVSVLDLTNFTFADEEFPGAAGRQVSPGELRSHGDWALRESPDALVNLEDKRVLPLRDIAARAGIPSPAAVEATAIDDRRCWIIAGGHLIGYDLATGGVQKWPLPRDHEYTIVPAGDLVVLLNQALEAPSRPGPFPQQAVPDMSQRTYATVLDVNAGKWLGKSVYRGDLRPAGLSGNSLWLAGSTLAVRINLNMLQSDVPTAAYTPSTDPATSLCRAAYAGDVDAVRRLLDEGVDANARVDEMTPLLAAVAADRDDVCRLLLDRGASPSVARTPSAYRVAAQNGAAKSLMALAGNDDSAITVADAQGALLPFAASAGSPSLIRELMAQNAQMRGTAPEPGSGSVFESTSVLAVRSANEAIVSALFSAPAIEPADVSRALFEVSRIENGAMVRLVMRQAQKSLSADEYSTAIARNPNLLRHVFGSGSEIEMLGRDSWVLSYALELGFEDVARKLLDDGVNPNAVHPGQFGDAPLIVACARSSTAMIGDLVNRGARWDTAVGDARVLDRAFVRAAMARRFELAADLLERGADVNTRTGSGTLLLHEMADNAPLVQLLLAWGADPALRDAKGRLPADATSNDTTRAMLTRQAPRQGRPTPWLAAYLLVEAATAGGIDGARKALDWGAFPDVEDYDEWPAIVLAASSGNVDLVSLLLERGAKVNETGPGGWTALMQAARRGDAALARVLLEAGAERGRKNYVRQTASDIATRRGHAEVAKLLQVQ